MENVKDVIVFSKEAVLPLLNLLGTSEKDKSPFCRQIDSPLELCDAFIKFCPAHSNIMILLAREKLHQKQKQAMM